MAASLPVYRTRPPTPIRALGSLLIAPNGVARRMLNVCQSAFMDISGSLMRSDPLDKKRDAFAQSVQRQALVGEKNALIKLCGCEQRFRAIAADNGAGIALDARVDTLVWGDALTIAKRLAGCIGRIFVARRSPARATGKGK